MSISPNNPRPDTGIAKDSNRSRLKIFLDVYTGKFSKLLLLNVASIILNIPAIFAAFYLSSYFFTADKELKGINFFIGYIVISLLVCFPIITIGPFQAGFTYILRNFAREEHTFIFDDFKEQTKRNWKQGLAISLIDLIIVTGLIIEINFFRTQTGLASNILLWLSMFVFVVFSMMHMYIYQMVVTIELKVFHIYKNALMLTLIHFFKNIFVYFLCTAILLLLAIFIPLGILGFVTVSMSTIGLIINFHAHTAIKKYLIDPVTATESNKP